MGVPAVGFAAKLGIGTSEPVTEPLEFLSENLRKTGTVLDTNGIRGTRSHSAERTRNGTYTVAVNGNQVFDTSNNALAANPSLADFDVDIGGTPANVAGSTTLGL